MAAEKTQGDGPSELIGLEYLAQEGDRVRARVPVTDRVRQPIGLVHGGVYSLIAESICSNGTWEGNDRKAAALGMSNDATFLRPISEGHINAEATPRHRGRTTWVWDVEFTDDEGTVCALVRMTVAVRQLAAPDASGTG
jgi:uncharacterized protein (TIGR00369 family)